MVCLSTHARSFRIARACFLTDAHVGLGEGHRWGWMHRVLLLDTTIRGAVTGHDYPGLLDRTGGKVSMKVPKDFGAD